MNNSVRLQSKTDSSAVIALQQAASQLPQQSKTKVIKLYELSGVNQQKQIALKEEIAEMTPSQRAGASERLSLVLEPETN